MLNQHVQTLYSMCRYLDKRYRLFNPCFSRVSPCYYCTTQPSNLNVQISVELLCLPTFPFRYPGETAGFHIKHGQSLKKKKKKIGPTGTSVHVHKQTDPISTRCYDAVLHQRMNTVFVRALDNHVLILFLNESGLHIFGPNVSQRKQLPTLCHT